MKTQDRKYYVERLETKPGEQPSGLEECGRAIFASLIMLGSIGLVLYVLYLLG